MGFFFYFFTSSRCNTLFSFEVIRPFSLSVHLFVVAPPAEVVGKIVSLRMDVSDPMKLRMMVREWLLAAGLDEASIGQVRDKARNM